MVAPASGPPAGVSTESKFCARATRGFAPQNFVGPFLYLRALPERTSASAVLGFLSHEYLEFSVFMKDQNHPVHFFLDEPQKIEMRSAAAYAI